MGHNDRRRSAPPLARTLPDLVREQAERSPESIALIWQGNRFTYREMVERAARVAGALRATGVRRGDRVGLLLGNRVEWLDVCLGAGIVGAVVAPLSTWSTRKELEFLLQDAGLSLLVASAKYGARDFEADLVALQGTPQMPSADRVWLLGRTESQFESYEEAIDTAAPIFGAPPGEGASAADNALVLYTSGSTSAPKSVPLRHFGIVENGFNIGERMGLDAGDRVLLPAPLFWSFGSANALPATLSHGAALVLIDKFDAGLALDAIERDRCTAIYTMPAMNSSLARHPQYAKERLATLRTGLSIGSPEEFLQAVDILGATELCNVYGSTETYGNCCVTSHRYPMERRANCQGMPLPGQQLRFVDEDTGAELPPHTPGLVEVRGYVALGYSGASADQNSKAFTADGFYRTGDIGLINPDGDFVFLGRASEMIKRSGINVSPAEVEAALLRHPSVHEAVVVGAPDTAKGERIVAFVVPAADAFFDAETLMQHCASELSKYKVPDRIERYTNLPLGVTGKVLRRELRQQAIELQSTTPVSSTAVVRD